MVLPRCAHHRRIRPDPRSISASGWTPPAPAGRSLGSLRGAGRVRGDRVDAVHRSGAGSHLHDGRQRAVPRPLSLVLLIGLLGRPRPPLSCRRAGSASDRLLEVAAPPPSGRAGRGRAVHRRHRRDDLLQHLRPTGRPLHLRAMSAPTRPPASMGISGRVEDSGRGPLVHELHALRPERRTGWPARSRKRSGREVPGHQAGCGRQAGIHRTPIESSVTKVVAVRRHDRPDLPGRSALGSDVAAWNVIIVPRTWTRKS